MKDKASKKDCEAARKELSRWGASFKPPTPAEKLANGLRPTLPMGYQCSECLMLNMSNPAGDSPEMVMISPSREVYRTHRLAKTLPVLRLEVLRLYETLKARGGEWLTISLDGCTIYLRPKE